MCKRNQELTGGQSLHRTPYISEVVPSTDDQVASISAKIHFLFLVHSGKESELSKY